MENCPARQPGIDIFVQADDPRGSFESRTMPFRSDLPSTTDLQNTRPVDLQGSQKASCVPHGGLRNIRHPALPAAISFATGIAVDRVLSFHWVFWLASSFVLAAAWFAALRLRRERTAALLLLACVACVGGARHHQAWSVEESNDISLYAGDERKLVHLTGILREEPRVQLRQKDSWRAAWPRADFTTANVVCHSLRTNSGTIPVSGAARLFVTGHLLHATGGDEVEIKGWLVRPGAPRNPGEFDSRDFLRREGAHCIVQTDHPDAILRLGDNKRVSFRREISRLRARVELLLAEHLSPETQPLASSLILGNRSGLTREVRDAFAESGMMHVLAISGQHVGILAALFWLCCRTMKLSDRTTSIAIIAVSTGYACLTLGEPPVVRATVMIVLVALGQPWHRRTSLINLLAVAALVLLIWRPSDLYDVGAQLSFLAVLGMGWFASTPLAQHRQGKSYDLRPGRHRGYLRTGTERFFKGLWLAYGLTAAIWLFTLPLVAARFHLVSPIGLVINVLLMPCIVGVLWLGYAFALCGVLFPPLASVLGPAFDFGLRVFLESVQASATWHLAWFHVPTIPEWWIGGYYVLLAGIVWGARLPRISCRTMAALILWVVVGLGFGLRSSATGELRVRFLSVGHGGAVLVEMPNGRTLLYDAGAIHDADYARHTVENALWEDHRRGIDALVISHADVDHFNAVPELMRGVPIGTLLVTKPFLDARQSLVEKVCETAYDHHVPISLVRCGDRLKIDNDVSIEVLHPPFESNAHQDNANSVVLLIEFAGRKILLTGDLSDVGLNTLLAMPPRAIDVLLAPHHGSLNSNPPALAAWAEPKVVVVSSGRTSVLPTLRNRYSSGADVLATHESGAITVEIDASGALRCFTHRPSNITKTQSDDVVINKPE
jgi:competence protein ComEC